MGLLGRKSANEVVKGPLPLRCERIDPVTRSPKTTGTTTINKVLEKLSLKRKDGESSDMKIRWATMWKDKNGDLSVVIYKDKLKRTELDSRDTVVPTAETLHQLKVHYSFHFRSSKSKKPNVLIRWYSDLLCEVSFGSAQPSENILLRFINPAAGQAFFLDKVENDHSVPETGNVVGSDGESDSFSEDKGLENSDDERFDNTPSYEPNSQENNNDNTDCNENCANGNGDSESISSSEEVEGILHGSSGASEDAEIIAVLATNDPYLLLGIPRDSDRCAVKKAFRKMALKWHPDKNSHASASICFAKINSAFRSALSAAPENVKAEEEKAQTFACKPDESNCSSYSSWEAELWEDIQFRAKQNPVPKEQHNRRWKPPFQDQNRSFRRYDNFTQDKYQSTFAKRSSSERLRRPVKEESKHGYVGIPTECFHKPKVTNRSKSDRRLSFERKGVILSKPPMEVSSGSRVEVFINTENRWVEMTVGNVSTFFDSFTVMDRHGVQLRVPLGGQIIVRSASTKGLVSLGGIPCN